MRTKIEDLIYKISGKVWCFFYAGYNSKLKRFVVAESGTDCDGQYSRNPYTYFFTLKQAVRYASRMAESSDGFCYYANKKSVIEN